MNDPRQRERPLDGVIQDPAGDEGFRGRRLVGLIRDSPQLNKLALDEALGAEALLLGRLELRVARCAVAILKWGVGRQVEQPA